MRFLVHPTWHLVHGTRDSGRAGPVNAGVARAIESTIPGWVRFRGLANRGRFPARPLSRNLHLGQLTAQIATRAAHCNLPTLWLPSQHFAQLATRAAHRNIHTLWLPSKPFAQLAPRAAQRTATFPPSGFHRNRSRNSDFHRSLARKSKFGPPTTSDFHRSLAPCEPHLEELCRALMHPPHPLQQAVWLSPQPCAV
jgi:hypothetical protein